MGICITGGKEHGLPIMISEIHPGQPADRTGGLFVGDAIVSANGVSMSKRGHQEAVQILSSMKVI